jgi:hypothetical protein
MKILPYESFAIDSRQSADAIAAALAAHVDPKSGFWSYRAGGKNFRGEVSRDGFKLTRSIVYRNSFLPVIVGKFEPGPVGTRISVLMRLHLFVLVFITVWLSAAGLAALIGLRFAASRREFGPALIPVGMFAFGCILTSAAFSYEAAKARELLIRILGGETAARP